MCIRDRWEDFSSTVGFWADMEHPYVTYYDDYIESEWWALKEIWNKKLLYKEMCIRDRFMVVMNVRTAMISEATLSFMGIGLPIEVITWGSMPVSYTHLSAIHEEEGEEKLHLLMVDDHIPAGAKLY